MTRIVQVQKLHGMRQTKVDGLLSRQINARHERDAKNAEFQDQKHRYLKMRNSAPQDFGELFEATADLEDSQSRFQSVTRTVLENRRAIETARRAMMDADELAKVAEITLQQATRDLTGAQAQLEAITVVLRSLKAKQDIHEENLADENALDDFAAKADRKPKWA